MVSLLGDVVAHLERREIPAALIGAAALVPYGIGRTTFDLDLMTVYRDVLSAQFWETVNGDIDVRRGDYEDPLAGVVRCNRVGERQVDVIVAKPKYVRAVVERAERKVVSGVELPVVRLADLVLLKLDAGGVQDKWDIDRILAAAQPALIAEVEQRLPELPADARQLWERIRVQ